MKIKIKIKKSGILKAESEKKTKAMIMKMRKAPGEKAAMENLLAKSEWWLERNMQEMPLMGDGKLMKEGENHVLQWVIGMLKKEVRN